VEAIALVGPERYRMWELYLAGVTLALADGSACIFQTLSSRHASKGVSGLPSTRAYLYRDDAVGRVQRDAA
jgi:cyclopropane-fatty-acyl-phospholipid synthase